MASKKIVKGLIGGRLSQFVASICVFFSMYQIFSFFYFVLLIWLYCIFYFYSLGNWKCNGTVAQINAMVDVLNKAGPFSANSEVVIAGPSIHLAAMKKAFRPDIAVAAEDVGFKKGYGAFTGEISAEMLADFGIKWTLTGHSERRVGFGYPGETSSVVGVKTKNAIDNGISVMACIGEMLADRQSGSTMKVCAEQLEGIKASLKTEDWKKVVIAYEPVWAIGTGVTASPQQVRIYTFE